MVGSGERAGVTFYFDPVCPWTWATSRWLVAAAPQRDLDIRWRTFSLALLNKDSELPAFLDTPEFRAKFALAAKALRVVQAAVAQEDNDAAGRFYTEWGTRFHDEGREPTPDLLDDAVSAAGVTAMAERADDPGLDAAIAASLDDALRLAGPDVGSPVLHVDGTERGVFGPIVSPPPAGEEAGQLWDAVLALQKIGSFYEVKRGRTGPPVFRPA
jgi:hypothetical protein